MQPELPWNVAGIPSEAREAARAAARREGLSVGEWMTRRILRGFPDAANDESARNWRLGVPEGSALPAEPVPLHSPRETEEMLARVSRSETESQGAYKALDQQLKTVARRLETTERNQTENNRAMTQAATQINIAAREQAQAYEQMSAHVNALAERLGRIERHIQTDGMRDAVKALHQGLSRVADQIADTASRSASQIASLAGNVESLTNQLVSTSEKVDATAVAVDAHVASLDERIRVVERTAFSSASALDLTMENVEQLRAAKDSVEEELHQHDAAVSEIRNESEQFGQRLAAGENMQGSLAVRIEDVAAQLQARDADGSLDRRLQGMEHVLSDIMGRLEHTEHTSAATSASVEQTLRELAASVEAADERNRDTVRELQAAVQDAAAKVAIVEEKLSAPPQLAAAVPESIAGPEPTTPAAANSAQPGKMILDAPPFADHAEPAHDFVSDFHPMTDAAHDVASAVASDTGDLPPFPSEEVPASAAFSEPFAASEGFLGEPESFLTTARRSANAAAVEKEATVPQSGLFPWTVPGEKTATAQPGRKRFAVAASVFAAAVAAALGGVVLTRGMGSTDPHAATVAAISQPLSARSASAAPPTTAETGLSSPPRRTATNDDEAPATQSSPVKSDVAAVAPSSAGHDTQAPKTRLADISARMTPPAAKAVAAGPKTIANATVASAPNSPAQRIVALANTGDSRAQLVLGMKYLEGSGTQINEAEAARWLARAAQQGEPLAQYRLGTLYERGRGVPTDAKLATHWYELAAKQGNRKAMHNLAVAFAEGSGEPKDNAQAAVWFAHAANLGLSDSQFNLAVLYERGMGVKQSLADAYKWYLVAAAQGDAESKSRAEALATQLNDSDRATAQAAAAAFKPQPLVPAANSLPVLG